MPSKCTKNRGLKMRAKNGEVPVHRRENES